MAESIHCRTTARLSFAQCPCCNPLKGSFVINASTSASTIFRAIRNANRRVHNTIQPVVLGKRAIWYRLWRGVLANRPAGGYGSCRGKNRSTTGFFLDCIPAESRSRHPMEEEKTAMNMRDITPTSGGRVRTIRQGPELSSLPEAVVEDITTGHMALAAPNMLV